MAFGRNEPCPCGSGKKYKHCCLDKQRDAPEFSEGILLRQRLDRVYEGLPRRLTRFAQQA